MCTSAETVVTTISMIAVSRSSRMPQSTASVPDWIQGNSSTCRMSPSKDRNTTQDSTAARNRSPVDT